MERVRVLFLPASGEGVGGGHVLRGLALAAALTEQGAMCGFAVETEGARLLQRFGGGLNVEAVERAGALSEIAGRWSAAVVVVDDYRLDASGEAGLASPSRLLVAVDDLANRPHLASLLIDPSYGRSQKAYEALLPSGAAVLAGPPFALLRPEFADTTPIDIEPRVERVFVGFGLADPGGVTLRAVTTLLPALPGVAFDVALGAGAQSLPGLQALAHAEPRLRLHVETDRAAALMARADLAVGGGGASTWERFRLGLPGVCVVVADNQRGLAHDLAAEGLQITLEADAAGFGTALAGAVQKLARDEAMRLQMAKAGRRLTDGQGARRVAQAILASVKTPGG